MTTIKPLTLDLSIISREIHITRRELQLTTIIPLSTSDPRTDSHPSYVNWRVTRLILIDESLIVIQTPAFHQTLMTYVAPHKLALSILVLIHIETKRKSKRILAFSPRPPRVIH